MRIALDITAPFRLFSTFCPGKYRDAKKLFHTFSPASKAGSFLGFGKLLPAYHLARGWKTKGRIFSGNKVTVAGVSHDKALYFKPPGI